MKKIAFILMLLFMATSYISAQDIIVKEDGETMKVYNVDVAQKYIYYNLTTEADAPIKKISRSKVMAVKWEDGKKQIIEDNFENKKEKGMDPSDFGDASLPVIDIDSYKGFLMQEGNVVYVECGDTPFEMAGAYTLSEALSKDKFWKIAKKKDQAHFVITYKVNLHGNDHVELSFFDKRNGLTSNGYYNQFFLIKDVTEDDAPFIKSDETIDGNEYAATRVYNIIKKVQDLIKSKEPDAPQYLDEFMQK